MSTGPVGSNPSPVRVPTHEREFEETPSLLEKAKQVGEEAIAWGLPEVPELLRDAFKSGEELKAHFHEHGFSSTVKHAVTEGRKELAHEVHTEAATHLGSGKMSRGDKLMLGLHAFESVNDIAKFSERSHEIGHLAGTLAEDSAKLFKGEKIDRHELSEAVYNGGLAGEEMLEAGERGMKTAMTGQKLVSTYRAASAAFREAAPLATKGVTAAAARAAVKATFDGTATANAASKLIKVASTTAAKATEEGLAHAVLGSAGRAAAKATLEGASHAAAEAAVKAGARVATGTLAKAAARFAPGLNIAMAVVDTASFVATMADPKASTGAKVCSGITALGSIVAATNFPVVSQVGAAVSIVSGFVGGFFR